MFQFKKIKCVNNSKNPDCLSFKDYTTEKLNCNYGILTGQINNITVVDLDFYDKKEKKFIYNQSSFIKEFGKDLSKFNTFTQLTPNGGFHLFFEYDPEIKQTKNSIHQIDIRNDGGYVVGYGSKINNNEYKILYKNKIQKMPNELKKWLLQNLYTKQEILTQKISSTKINKNDYVQSQFIYKNNKNIYKKVFDNLPKEYINNYGTGKKGCKNWLTFTTFCKITGQKDLWDEYSKKSNKYDKIQNFKMWNTVNCNYDCFNSLFNDKRLNNYKHLKYYLKYKPLEKFNIDCNFELDKKKLGYEFFNEFDKKKSLIIKSDTGTGKTTSFKHYIKKNNKPFISIVSRVSLGTEQYHVFNKFGIDCKFYKLVNYFEKGQNYIITIDSLLKLLQDDFNFEDYHIFLDEFNSIIEHLIDSSTLKNNRIEIYQYFIDILNNCSRFIGVDADISQISIEFLKLINKDKFFVRNKYQHNKNIDCFEINEFDDLINKVKEEQKFIICCDSKTNAIYLYSKLEDESIKLITSETEEHINLDQYDKIIYSPKIIYGLDSTIKRNVYCCFNTQTINPAHMIQQIARTRNIIKLYYFFETKCLYNPYYNNFDECKILNCDYKKLRDLYTKRYGIKKQSYKDYLNLYCILDYKKDCYKTNVFLHFIELLKDRGFNVRDEYFKTNYTDKETSKEKSNEKSKYLEEIFDVNSEYFKNLNRILKITKSEDLERFKPIICDNLKVSNHFNLCNYFFKEIENLQDEIIKVNEMEIKKIKDKKNKIIWFKKLLLLLKFDDNNVFEKIKLKQKPKDEFFKLTPINHKELNNKLIKEYSMYFRDRSNKITFNNSQSALKIVIKIFKSLFNCVFDSKRINKYQDKKQIKKICYKWNSDFIKELYIHFDLMSIRNPTILPDNYEF